MSDSRRNDPESDDQNLSAPGQMAGGGVAIGMGSGVAIGVGLGAALGNIALGIGIGLAIGGVLSMALAIAYSRAGNRDDKK